MRVLAHVSDLHFGRSHAAVLRGLSAALHSIQPDLVVVSGDLTQRARETEFQQACEFLDNLPLSLVVPGNHDVLPWWNPLGRWRWPLKNYRRYISEEPEPFLVDSEIAIVGVNTARSASFNSGRLNAAQVARACERLRLIPPGLTRIIVTHHPFDLPEHHRGHDVVGRAQMAMSVFAACGVELFLAGHLHVSHIGETTLRYRIPGYSALVVQAGTATSTRERGELNSWNLIRINRPHIHVDRYSWDQRRGKFFIFGTDSFRRTSQGWERTGQLATGT
jgi:3',5'-cyclic AMP phosphodiesterase CpdA